MAPAFGCRRELKDLVPDHRHEKLIKRGKRLAHGIPVERHRVRIAAKKARYATEFFHSLYLTKLVDRYIRRLSAL